MLRFPSLLPHVLFLFQESTLHLVITSPWAPLGWDSFPDFPFGMTLAVLKSAGWAHHGMPHCWDLSELLLMMSVRLWVWGREGDHRGNVPFSLHHLKGTYHGHDLQLLMLALITWREVESIRFLNYQVTLLCPISLLCFLEGSHYRRPTHQEGGCSPMFFKGTRDNTSHYIHIHLLKVGCIAFIVSKGWQGRKSLSQWKAELTARGQMPK